MTTTPRSQLDPHDAELIERARQADVYGVVGGRQLPTDRVSAVYREVRHVAGVARAEVAERMQQTLTGTTPVRPCKPS